VLLVTDSGLNDELVESVWDEGDSDINLGNLFVERFAVVHIKGDGMAVREAFRELLGTVESATGDGDGDASLTQNACSRPEAMLKTRLVYLESYTYLTTKPAPRRSTLGGIVSREFLMMIFGSTDLCPEAAGEETMRPGMRFASIEVILGGLCCFWIVYNLMISESQ